MEPHVITLLRGRRPEGVHSEHVKAAREHAVEAYPNEAVGIATPEGYIRLDNLASEPGCNFEVDPAFLIEHPVIFALIHSHPDGDVAPTFTDMQSQIAMDVPWGILAVGAGGDCTDEPVWFGDQCPVPPLVGRMFLHGVTDCYSLIRDYYRTERDILLPEFPRDDEWWDAGQNLYEENFQRAGFKRIDVDAELQPGDGFLCRFRSPVVNHAGIYAGGGLILHHLAGHVSGHSPLNIWRRTIDYWVRYEG